MKKNSNQPYLFGEEAFAIDNIISAPIQGPVKIEHNYDVNKISSTLLKKVESLQNAAEKLNTEVIGNWTYRRQRFADSAYKKKETMLKHVGLLKNLSDCWINNTEQIFKWKLDNIRNQTDIEYVFNWGYPAPPDENHPIDGWYREQYPDRLKKANKLGMFSKEDAETMREGLNLLKNSNIISTEEMNKRIINEAVKKIRGQKIPGFFPTPDDVIDTMIYYSVIEDGMSILEPSAGIGSIPDRVKYKGYNVNFTCVERMYSLYEILSLKGYKSIQGDILEWDSNGEQFDRILMNPPFEKGQDVQHIIHCFNKYLKSGGILVAIASASIENNTQSKYKEFREFLEEQNATINHNGQVFKEAFNSTGVSTVTIILTKWNQ